MSAGGVGGGAFLSAPDLTRGEWDALAGVLPERWRRRALFTESPHAGIAVVDLSDLTPEKVVGVLLSMLFELVDAVEGREKLVREALESGGIDEGQGLQGLTDMRSIDPESRLD